MDYIFPIVKPITICHFQLKYIWSPPYVISVFTMQQRFRAKVVEKDEETGEVVVHFDGWSSRYDELISIGEGRLRPLSQEQLQKASRTCKHKVGRVLQTVKPQHKHR